MKNSCRRKDSNRENETPYPMKDFELFERLFNTFSIAVQLDEKVKECYRDDMDQFVCQKIETDLRTAKSDAYKALNRYVAHMIAENESGVFEVVRSHG